MILSGDLGIFSKEWAGWIIRRGLLISPEDFEATPADVRSLPFMRMQIAAYQADARMAREPQIEEQPSPESWDWQELVG